MGLLTALYVYLVFVPKMFLMNFFMRLMNLFPKRSVNAEFFKGNFKKEDQDHWKNWLGSNRQLKAALRTAKIQAAKEAEQNGPAIDVELFDLKEKSSVKLFDFIKANRPLVLNFGSCT